MTKFPFQIVEESCSNCNNYVQGLKFHKAPCNRVVSTFPDYCQVERDKNRYDPKLCGKWELKPGE